MGEYILAPIQIQLILDKPLEVCRVVDHLRASLALISWVNQRLHFGPVKG